MKIEDLRINQEIVFFKYRTDVALQTFSDIIRVEIVGLKKKPWLEADYIIEVSGLEDELISDPQIIYFSDYKKSWCLLEDTEFIKEVADSWGLPNLPELTETELEADINKCNILAKKYCSMLIKKYNQSKPVYKKYLELEQDHYKLYGLIATQCGKFNQLDDYKLYDPEDIYNSLCRRIRIDNIRLKEYNTSKPAKDYIWKYRITVK